MSSESASQQPPVETDQQADSPAYVAPAVTVLGTVAELTQLGTALNDELLNEGSQV